MRKINTLIAIIILCCELSYGQLGYFSSGTTQFLGTYSSLSSTTGNTIVTDSLDNGLSDSLPIGFTFHFNQQTFTHFIFGTNGFIKLGKSLPSTPNLFLNQAQQFGFSPFNSPSAADSNLVLPFAFDLEPSTVVTPDFRYHTTGTIGNRVLTIQWKGVSDKVPSNVAGSLKQYSSLEFQIKLFEGSNNIQFVYGNFIPTSFTDQPRYAAVGIKGIGNTFSDLVSLLKFSTSAWNSATAQVSINTFNFRNNVNPTVGQTFSFNAVSVDVINLGLIGTPVACSHIPMNHKISLKFRCNGPYLVNRIVANYQKIGGPIITEVINNIASNRDTTYEFQSPLIASTSGDSVRFWLTTMNDSDPTNNVAGYRFPLFGPNSTFPYIQNFNSPNGWNIEQIALGSTGSPGNWVYRTTPITFPVPFYPGSPFLHFDSYSFREETRSRLVFKCGFDFSNLQFPQVSFKMTKDNSYRDTLPNGSFRYPDRVILLASTNNGATFVEIDSVFRPHRIPHPNNLTFDTYIFKLDSFAYQPNVIIALDAVSGYGSDISIDSLVISNTTDTLKSFSLLAPANGNSINIPAQPSFYTFNWQKSTRSLQGPVVNYKILFATANGNFNNPIFSIPSNNNGLDSFLVISWADIENFLANNGILNGQSANLKWTVEATSGNRKTFASSSFLISFTRPAVSDTIQQFNLISPSNNSTINVSAGNGLAIDVLWQRTKTVSNQSIRYEWLLDFPTGDFTNPIIVLSANNSGSDSILTLTHANLVSILNVNGFSPGQTVPLKWTTRARTSWLNRIASLPHNLIVNFDFPVSANEMNSKDRIILYPNPSKSGESRLKLNLVQDSEVQIQVTDLQGRVLNTSIEKEVRQKEILLPTMGLSPGMYLVVVQYDTARIIHKLQLN